MENGWTVGRFRALDEVPRLVHAVTTRKAMDVMQVRHDHAGAAGQLERALGLRGVAFVEQVHGGRVLAAEGGGLAGDADGLVGKREGPGLMMRSADCPLILAVDPASGVIGSAHASWRGTAAKVATEMVRRMAQDLGASAAGIVACICPSAGACCYQVGPDVVEAFTQSLGPSAAEFFQRRPGGMYLDLWSANRDQLLRCGLRETNIHVSGVCTMCAVETFPSHRREGQSAGRLAAVIGWHSSCSF
jgi:hypothetical protein